MGTRLTELPDVRNEETEGVPEVRVPQVRDAGRAGGPAAEVHACEALPVLGAHEVQTPQAREGRALGLRFPMLACGSVSRNAHWAHPAPLRREHQPAAVQVELLQERKGCAPEGGERELVDPRPVAVKDEEGVEVGCDELDERGHGALERVLLRVWLWEPVFDERGRARRRGEEEVSDFRDGRMRRRILGLGLGLQGACAFGGEALDEVCDLLGGVALRGAEDGGGEADGADDLTDRFGDAGEGAACEPAICTGEGEYLLEELER